MIRDTIDKVLVLRFGRASDPVSLLLDDVVSKFASVALVDIDSKDVGVYVGVRKSEGLMNRINSWHKKSVDILLFKNKYIKEENVCDVECVLKRNRMEVSWLLQP
ncbi:hypothetical protein UlMin_014017 [Ulmus minor]